MEFTLLWAALTAAAGLWLGVRIFRNTSETAFDNLLAATVAGLAGGRVVAMISQGLNPLANPVDLLIVRGGVNTAAATSIAIAVFYLVSGRKISTMDTAAPAALLGLASWHLGCLWRGACLGVASDVPWAWSEAGSSITRHPVEIYAGVGLVIIALLITRLPQRVGVWSSAGLLGASGLRLATEPLRLTISGGPVFWYAIGILIGAIGMAASLRLADRSDLSVVS